jgi:hypothetical protein
VYAISGEKETQVGLGSFDEVASGVAGDSEVAADLAV